MDQNTLIIENGHLQGYSRRIGQGLLTLVFWVAWGYLFIPILNPIIEYFGGDIIYHSKFNDEMFFDLFIKVILVSATIAVFMVIWRYYNMFLSKCYRNHHWLLPGHPHKDTAEYFGISTSDLGLWHQAKELNIHLNEKGNIEHVRIIC